MQEENNNLAVTHIKKHLSSQISEQEFWEPQEASYQVFNSIQVKLKNSSASETVAETQKYVPQNIQEHFKKLKDALEADKYTHKHYEKLKGKNKSDDLRAFSATHYPHFTFWAKTLVDKVHDHLLNDETKQLSDQVAVSLSEEVKQYITQTHSNSQAYKKAEAINPANPVLTFVAATTASSYFQFLVYYYNAILDADFEASKLTEKEISSLKSYIKLLDNFQLQSVDQYGNELFPELDIYNYLKQEIEGKPFFETAIKERNERTGMVERIFGDKPVIPNVEEEGKALEVLPNSIEEHLSKAIEVASSEDDESITEWKETLDNMIIELLFDQNLNLKLIYRSLIDSKTYEDFLIEYGEGDDVQGRLNFAEAFAVAYKNHVFGIYIDRLTPRLLPELKETLDNVDKRRQRVGELVKEGLDIFEALKKATNEFPDLEEGPVAQEMTLINQLMLNNPGLDKKIEAVRTEEIMERMRPFEESGLPEVKKFLEMTIKELKDAHKVANLKEQMIISSSLVNTQLSFGFREIYQSIEQLERSIKSGKEIHSEDIKKIKDRVVNDTKLILGLFISEVVDYTKQQMKEGKQKSTLDRVVDTIIEWWKSWVDPHYKKPGKAYLAASLIEQERQKVLLFKRSEGKKSYSAPAQQPKKNKK